MRRSNQSRHKAHSNHPFLSGSGAFATARGSMAYPFVLGVREVFTRINRAFMDRITLFRATATLSRPVELPGTPSSISPHRACSHGTEDRFSRFATQSSQPDLLLTAQFKSKEKTL